MVPSRFGRIPLGYVPSVSAGMGFFLMRSFMEADRPFISEFRVPRSLGNDRLGKITSTICLPF